MLWHDLGITTGTKIRGRLKTSNGKYLAFQGNIQELYPKFALIREEGRAYFDTIHINDFVQGTFLIATTRREGDGSA
ncbi:hypothetical protein [Heliorestis convoluta]|uniref:Uncharacterized protein n=1 Tax=Heliorestis convoluta TaxID=356322 RepID=A0A5Q2N2Q9_9FIRM|nr:hypothetical protein [Heliorestis convoluta]QGG46855.1 hypothetical protein FTV88_0677 [Heliorestis convoluta]